MSGRCAHTPLRACARRVQRSGRSTRPPAAGCWSATALGHHSRMATAHPFTTERVANDGPTDDSAVAGCRQGVPSPKNLYVSVTDIAFRRSAWTGDETRLSPGGSEPCARRRRPLGTAPLRCRTPACCARLAEALSPSDCLVTGQVRARPGSPSSQHLCPPPGIHAVMTPRTCSSASLAVDARAGRLGGGSRGVIRSGWVGTVRARCRVQDGHRQPRFSDRLESTS